MKVRVTPGEGLVARAGDGLLLVLPGGDDASADTLIAALEETCTGQATPGRALARRLVGFLVQAEPSAVPPFAALAPTDEGWAVTIHGGVEVHVGERGGAGAPERLSGRDAATWLDRILPAGFGWLAVAPDGAGRPEPGRLVLEAGKSYGGALLVELDAAGAAPAQAPSQPAAQAPSQALSQPAQAPSQPAAQALSQPAAQAPSQPAAQAPSQAPSQPAPSPPAPAGHDHPGHDHAGHEHAQEDEPPTVPLPTVAQPAAAVAAVLPPPPVAAPPAQAPSAPAAPEVPAADVPFRAISLLQPAADLEARAPLPVLGDEQPDGAAPEEDDDAVLVDGILCERNHFNHPYALYCSACGVSTVHRTRAVVKGPRPSLGVVVSDDGVTYSLDSDYIVGREPDREPSVQAGQMRFMRLEDQERSVSRVHAEIRLQDWDVYIVDRGSANGTFVAGRDETQWTRLAAGKPHPIQPGTRIAFGRRVLTYDTHHQA